MNLGQLSQTYDRVEFDTESGEGEDSRRYFVTLDSKIGVYDIGIDKLVVPVAYDAVQTYPRGCYLVSLNGKWGLYFYCYDGGIVVKIEYDEIPWSAELPDNAFVVGKDGKFGMIDVEGNILVPIEFELCGDGILFVHTSNKEDQKPELVSVARRDSNGLYKEGLYSVPQKRLVIPIEYDNIMEGRNENSFSVFREEKRGAFDLTTQIVEWEE